MSLGTFHKYQLFTVLKGEIFKSLKKAVPVLSWIGGNISSNLAFLAISDFLLLYTTESSGSCLLGTIQEYEKVR